MYHQDGISHRPKPDALPQSIVHHPSGETQGSRIFQEHTALNMDSSLKKSPCSRGQLRPAPTPEHSLPQDVPQIRVRGQRSSLGISIAGGKGSLPYKQQDEGIFISRVTQEGPSEKAGVRVGDRLLEVNGLSMHGSLTSMRSAP
ncbi:hypothetical protein WMY93_007164 [Mugilogobius chulae]|uniref:PDZ domain-containing protein n=1 Tax=Mugilogobius chulae TaxID=88201 RepID=A0AAW0PWG9_9GOBI